MRFDALALDAFGFACTGSTYLCGHAAERAQVDGARTAFRLPGDHGGRRDRDRPALPGCPAHCLHCTLPGLARRAWRDLLERPGFRRGQRRTSRRCKSADTRNIYALGSDAGIAQMRHLNDGSVDAVVFSGTGMPNLRAPAGARTTRAARRCRPTSASPGCSRAGSGSSTTAWRPWTCWWRDARGGHALRRAGITPRVPALQTSAASFAGSGTGTNKKEHAKQQRGRPASQHRQGRRQLVHQRRPAPARRSCRRPARPTANRPRHPARVRLTFRLAAAFSPGAASAKDRPHAGIQQVKLPELLRDRPAATARRRK